FASSGSLAALWMFLLIVEDTKQRQRAPYGLACFRKETWVIYVSVRRLRPRSFVPHGSAPPAANRSRGRALAACPSATNLSTSRTCPGTRAESRQLHKRGFAPPASPQAGSPSRGCGC